MLLVLFGVLFAALFLLNNLIKTLARRDKVGFVDLLLAFLASLLFVVGLTMSELDAQADPLIPTLMRNVGGGLAFFSLLIMIAEYRRPQRLRSSRGLLGLGVGLLVVAASVSVPLAARYFIVPTPTAIQLSGNAAGTSARGLVASATATEPPTMTATSRPTLTPSATRTPQPTLTATATRQLLVAPTAEATATPSVVCVALVDFNLRLRAEPSRDAETLLVIPNVATLSLFARNRDSTWFYTEYANEFGWVAGEYITLTDDCNELAVRE